MMIVYVVEFLYMKLVPVMFLELMTLLVANGYSRTVGPLAFPTIIAVGMELNGENKVVYVMVLLIVIPTFVFYQQAKSPEKLKPDRVRMVRVARFSMPRLLATNLLLTILLCVLPLLGKRVLASVPIQPLEKSVPLILIIPLLFMITRKPVLLLTWVMGRTPLFVLNTGTIRRYMQTYVIPGR